RLRGPFKIGLRLKRRHHEAICSASGDAALAAARGGCAADPGRPAAVGLGRRPEWRRCAIAGPGAGGDRFGAGAPRPVTTCHGRRAANTSWAWFASVEK